MNRNEICILSYKDGNQIIETFASKELAHSSLQEKYNAVYVTARKNGSEVWALPEEKLVLLTVHKVTIALLHHGYPEVSVGDNINVGKSA